MAAPVEGLRGAARGFGSDGHPGRDPPDAPPPRPPQSQATARPVTSQRLFSGVRTGIHPHTCPTPPAPSAPAWCRSRTGTAISRKRGICCAATAFRLHAPHLHCLHQPAPRRGGHGLVAGEAVTGIAARLGLSPDAVDRHARNHLRRLVAQVREAITPPPLPTIELIPPNVALQGVLTVHGLAHRLGALVGRAEALLRDAEEDGRWRCGGGAIPGAAGDHRGRPESHRRCCSPRRAFQAAGPVAEAGDGLLAAWPTTEARSKAAQALPHGSRRMMNPSSRRLPPRGPGSGPKRWPRPRSLAGRSSCSRPAAQARCSQRPRSRQDNRRAVAVAHETCLPARAACRCSPRLRSASRPRRCGACGRSSPPPGSDSPPRTSSASKPRKGRA
jgi:hypothetical protein